MYTTSRACVWIPNEKLDENLYRIGYCIQIFRDLDTICKCSLFLGKSCDINKLIWSKWHLKQTAIFYFLQTMWLELQKCKDQCAFAIFLHQKRFTRRQYCKASERDIVHPTYLQPPARACIASSLDFWHSCFQWLSVNSCTSKSMSSPL